MLYAVICKLADFLCYSAIKASHQTVLWSLHYATFIKKHVFCRKRLEWIGMAATGYTTYYKDSLKSKFSISTDSSSKTVTLTGQNVQPDDTAVYYCARNPH
uniref:Ig-like domain-containing protein n=1 Tax=Oreochromis niloticus TaxID=8128 RepID=A0A669CZT6_ORENI